MVTLTDSEFPATEDAGLWLYHSVMPRRVRPIRQWAEEEVVIPPNAPKYRNLPFRVHRQPFSGLLLDEISNPYWRTIVISGPSQSSKSLCGFSLPIIHTLAEEREDPIMGVPEADMADDKWKKDILPIMEASPNLRRLLPTTGAGSRSGKIKDSVDFVNGVRLKVMSRGGQDTAKAGYTSKRIRLTEAAGFSNATATSSEADVFRQYRARMRGYELWQQQAIIEGTMSIAEEYPWRLRGTEESMISTMSRLVTPCPHCEAWIAPDREDFHGWQDAKSELQAEEMGSFYCPACGEQLTEEQRVAANADIRLVHYGQSVNDRGKVVGPTPETRTLWFAWTPWHNLLVSPASLAVEEWVATQLDEGTSDRNDAEKALCQFGWGRVWEPPDTDEIPLTQEDVLGRASELTRGVLPVEATRMSAAVDVRASQIHFVVIAWHQNGSGHRVDYGSLPCARHSLGVRRGVLAALRELRDKRLAPGYQDASGRRMAPSVVFIDAGWKAEVVRAFVRESRAMGLQHWYPSFGRGQSKPRGQGSYSHPTKIAGDIVFIGDEYHMRIHPKHGLVAAIVNSDEWKSNVHEGFAIPVDQPGALTSFVPVTEDEIKTERIFSRQCTAEKSEVIVVRGRGPVTVWRNDSHKPNHGLDVMYNACAAGHRAGVRIIEQQRVHRPPQPIAKPIVAEDRPYLACYREE